MGDELRELLQREADALPPAGPAPAPTLRRARRRVAVTVAAGLLVVAAVAFGSYTGVTALANRPLREVPVSHPPTPGTSFAPPTFTPTPTGVLSPPTCLDATMSTTVASSQVAAGTIRWVLRSTNTSGHACRSQGYPGMDFHASTGWLNVQVHRGGFPDIGGSPQPQVVGAGQSVYFVAYWSDVSTSAGTCTQFDQIKVTLPNNFVSLEISGTGCVIPSSVDVGPMTTTAPSP